MSSCAGLVAVCFLAFQGQVQTQQFGFNVCPLYCPYPKELKHSKLGLWKLTPDKKKAVKDGEAPGFETLKYGEEFCVECADGQEFLIHEVSVKITAKAGDRLKALDDDIEMDTDVKVFTVKRDAMPNKKKIKQLCLKVENPDKEEGEWDISDFFMIACVKKKPEKPDPKDEGDPKEENPHDKDPGDNGGEKDQEKEDPEDKEENDPKEEDPDSSQNSSCPKKFCKPCKKCKRKRRVCEGMSCNNEQCCCFPKKKFSKMCKP